MIIALIYIRRIIRRSAGQLVLLNDNWRGIVLSCIVLSNKVWDDFHVKNEDYCFVFKGLTLERVNELEKKLLIVLENTCNVSPSAYARTHFEIQDMITLTKIDQGKPTKQRVKRNKFTFTSSAKVHVTDNTETSGHVEINSGNISPLPLSPFCEIASSRSNSSRLIPRDVPSTLVTINEPITPGVGETNDFSAETTISCEQQRSSDSSIIRRIVLSILNGMERMSCITVANVELESPTHPPQRSARKAFVGRLSTGIAESALRWFRKEEKI